MYITIYMYGEALVLMALSPAETSAKESLCSLRSRTPPPCFL